MINISIVLYNTPTIEINQLLETLSKISLLNKIYLIDNSKEPTPGYWGENIEYIFNGKNIGYGAGHNIAINESIKNKIKYHLVINHDIIVQPEVITTLVESFESDPSIGMMMPQVLNLDHTIQLSPKLIPTPLYVLISAFSPLRFLFKRQFNNYTLRHRLNTKCNVPVISGCFSFFRVKVLEEVGLYDDQFFMYFEDDDISRRVHRHYKTIYDPSLYIYHAHHRGATKKLSLFITFAKSAILYFNKFGWFFDKERRLINKRTLQEVQ